MLELGDDDLVAGPQRASDRLGDDADAVVPRVKTISSRAPALMKRCTRSRAASYSSVASSPSVWMERWTLACEVS
jgi:hypothetical protein